MDVGDGVARLLGALLLLLLSFHLGRGFLLAAFAAAASSSFCTRGLSRFLRFGSNCSPLRRTRFLKSRRRSLRVLPASAICSSSRRRLYAVSRATGVSARRRRVAQERCSETAGCCWC